MEWPKQNGQVAKLSGEIQAGYSQQRLMLLNVQFSTSRGRSLEIGQQLVQLNCPNDLDQRFETKLKIFKRFEFDLLKRKQNRQANS